MIKSSRRAIFLFALVGFALSLAGCGEEAAQRKAFIQFLQTRIIDKPGLHSINVASFVCTMPGIETGADGSL